MSLNQEKKHNVMEFHRGEWQPLKAENGKFKHVMITEETAERMNMYAQEERIKYVLAKEKVEKAEEIEVNEEEVVDEPKNKGGRPKKK